MKNLLILSLFFIQFSYGQVSKVSVNGHVLVVCSNSLFAWGFSSSGQLGVSTFPNSYSGISLFVPSINNVKDIYVGFDHSIALDHSGNVWTFGANYDGQLGDGTNTAKTTPAIVLSNVNSISTHHTHCLALKNDGTVWAWGDNLNGQLGDNSTVDKNIPVQVSGLSNIVYIKAGLRCSFAIKADGTLWAWGSNSVGKLGDGTNTQRNTPVQISVNKPVEIACGSNHTLILDSLGAILACGSGGFGQFGNGNNTTSYSPIYTGNNGFKSISAGQNVSVGLKNNGTVWAWGESTFGALGLGSSITTTNVATMVSGINNVTFLAKDSRDIVFVIKNDGTLWGWGRNEMSQIVDDPGPGNKYTPQIINNPCGGGAIGITENEINTIKWSLFPNPSAGSFEFDCDLELENGTLTIVNTLGEIIMTTPLQTDLVRVPASLDNGIYFVQFKSNNKLIGTKKIVIER
jgi:alpha-tubulin suppressor-like RCC1 family protein